ncbi:hypothetical protein BDR05DRAFT_1006008 [Suillus weaverae]|nr:hypothetical protein BDR05DRAFT_1006008 [Suillus weaverae]
MSQCPLPMSHVSWRLFFFGCSTLPLKVLSTTGVRDASDVRAPDPMFSSFLKYLPVLPAPILQSSDVLAQLRQHSLNEEELIAGLKWWVRVGQQDPTHDTTRARTELLNATILSLGSGKDARPVPLSMVQYFIHRRMIPLDGPLPVTLMPLSITKHFTQEQLRSFEWRECSILDFIQDIFNLAQDITRSSEWAERGLTVLARAWPLLSRESHELIKAMLAQKSANIFKDLPVVTFTSGGALKGSMEKLLSFVGVRKHVDLQVVFDRMVKTGDWTISDLMTHLVTIQSTLTPDEITELQMTPAFSKEGENSFPEKKSRYRASDLYEPSITNRQLAPKKVRLFSRISLSHLRPYFPTSKASPSTRPAKNPPWDLTVKLCTSSELDIRSAAFKYLIDSIPSRYPDYRRENFGHVAFIPAVNDFGPCMGTPNEVFASHQWKVLGFSVVEDAVWDIAAMLQTSVAIYRRARPHESFSHFAQFSTTIKPLDVVIVDDTNAYKMFGESIYTAPQEDLVENFYATLGSRRLSAVVKEDYRVNSEMKHNRSAADIRTLLLEGLPLFLHEHTHTRTKVSLGWLSNQGIFIFKVRVFGKLTVVKSLSFRDNNLKREQDASAPAKRSGHGPIELWLPGSTQVDMYDPDPAMKSWNDEMCYMCPEAHTEFFQKVQSQYEETLNMIKMSEPEEKTDSNPVAPTAEETPTKLGSMSLTDEKTVAPKLEGESFVKISYDDMLRVLQPFDEAHPLSNMSIKGFRPPHIMGRAINRCCQDNDASVWVIFASTTSQVADFSAPQVIHDSLLIAVAGQLVYPPYTHRGWDQNADPLTDISANNVARFDHIVGFGRPLFVPVFFSSFSISLATMNRWKSLMDKCVIAGILKLAAQKLCKSKIFDPMDTSQALAVLSQRFGLDIWPLRCCFDAGFHQLSIGAPSVLHCSNSTPWDAYQSGERFGGLEEKGSLYPPGPSEGVIQDLHYNGSGDAELIDCQKVSVIDFQEYLFGKTFWSRSVEAKIAFQHACINFSHWVPMIELISPRVPDQTDANSSSARCTAKELTLQHWHRTSAVQCCHLQPLVDKMILIAQRSRIVMENAVQWFL